MPVGDRLRGLLGHTPGEAPKPTALRDNVLKDLVSKRDRVPDPPRTNPKGYIHISSLVRGDCPRFLSLSARSKIVHTSRVTGAQRVLWAMGRAAEHHVRTQLIAELNWNEIYGEWWCPCHNPDKGIKGRTRVGFAKDDRTCSRCGQFAMRYVEYHLECDEYKVVGHPDFILILGGCIVPVEIKSLNNSDNANSKEEGFDTLTSPFPDHCLQVAGYHRMLSKLSKKLGIPLSKHCVVYYVGKAFNGFKHPFPYKEFHINPYTYKPQIQGMFEDAKAAYNGIRSVLPARLGLCRTLADKLPCKCMMAQPCFQTETGVKLAQNLKITKTNLRE